MPIRDILLHLDASPAYGGRLRATLWLARVFEARVVGVLNLPEPEVVALAQDGATAAALAAELARLEEEAGLLGSKFMSVLGRHGLAGEWHTARGPAAAVLAHHAKATDLVVLSQDDPDHPGDLPAPENVVLACGRPVLLVPHVGRFEHVGTRVVIAWNGSRAATRAAHAALPLLGTSETVTVFHAKPPTTADTEDHSADLVRHLQRQGLRARSETMLAAPSDVAQALQSRALDLGADLIVMGAFSHSRLRETILGGTTQDMLGQMMLPVLMAH